MANFAPTYYPRKQSSWGQHGAQLGPVGPRWATCWPHEPCYQGFEQMHALFHSPDRLWFLAWRLALFQIATEYRQVTKLNLDFMNLQHTYRCSKYFGIICENYEKYIISLQCTNGMIPCKHYYYNVVKQMAICSMNWLTAWSADYFTDSLVIVWFKSDPLAAFSFWAPRCALNEKAARGSVLNRTLL